MDVNCEPAQQGQDLRSKAILGDASEHAYGLGTVWSLFSGNEGGASRAAAVVPGLMNWQINGRDSHMNRREMEGVEETRLGQGE